MVHFATFVASSYSTEPPLAESVVVLTHLGNGISSTTSSTLTGPSRPGGTNETTRSRSYRFMRTHGWNEQSSITSGS